MYIVIELQASTDGTVGSLVYAFDNLDEAQSRYHAILAAAAVSVLPCHAAIILRNDGMPIEYRSFKHATEAAAAIEE